MKIIQKQKGRSIYFKCQTDLTLSVCCLDSYILPTLFKVHDLFLRVGCTESGGKTSDCAEGELLRMPELSSSTTSCKK